MTQKRSSRLRPPRRPRKIRSVIYGPEGEVIYAGDDPAEASRIWGEMMRAADPEQFGDGKKERKARFGSLHR